VKSVQKWLQWSFATKPRYVLLWGCLFFGGLFAVFGAIAISLALKLGADINTPTHGQTFFLIFVCLIGGAVVGWRMWPTIQRIRYGQVPLQTKQTPARRLLMLGFWILVATLLVFVANLIRG
jgi:hypothetical protein